MSRKNSPTFPIFEIVAIIDATTVAVAGPKVYELKENDRLYIIATGKAIVPKVNMPLVSAKAKLVVTLPAGEYVLARTPIEEKATTYGAVFDVLAPKIVERRAPLHVSEREMIGNPGRHPVRVGDPVVKVEDLPAYVHWYAKEHEVAKTEEPPNEDVSA